MSSHKMTRVSRAASHPAMLWHSPFVNEKSPGMLRLDNTE